jgi:uncharacterized protein (DUF433 family)
MNVQWKQHIVSDPEILRGKPRIKGTRIPVGLVLGQLAESKTSAEILAEFPDLAGRANCCVPGLCTGTFRV